MPTKCKHGYFEHSPYNRCPWCHGWDKFNKDAVPVLGRGNGWLLKKGNVPCSSCGGPAAAGWGLATAEGATTTTHNHPCYACTVGIK